MKTYEADVWLVLKSKPGFFYKPLETPEGRGLPTQLRSEQPLDLVGEVGPQLAHRAGLELADALL